MNENNYAVKKVQAGRKKHIKTAENAIIVSISLRLDYIYANFIVIITGTDKIK
jgi:hypothetical protein